MRSLVQDHFAIEEVALNLNDIQTAEEIFLPTAMAFALSRSLGNIMTTPILFQESRQIKFTNLIRGLRAYLTK